MSQRPQKRSRTLGSWLAILASFALMILPQLAWAAEGEGEEVESTNMLVYLYESLGIFFVIVFLALSFAFVAMLVIAILSIRRSVIVPLDLVDEFELCLDEKRYQDAFELAQEDESFLGRVLSAGLVKLSTGYEQAIEAMQEVGEEESMKLEHKASYVALIGAVAPMIGLFGTVCGMIGAFITISRSTQTPEANILARDISQALVTTLLGLAIAIPAILGFGLIRNRVARLVLEVGILSEGLMSRFQRPGKK